MRNTFLTFGAPDLQATEIAEVVAALEAGWIGTGPRVHQFEHDFATYKHLPSSRVAAVNSCTAALHLSLIAAELGPGDEVITSALTFCATVNAIIHCGAQPVLADVDPVTLNLDPDDVARRITPRTRALLPVHFAGRPCDMDRLRDLAQAHNLIVIEDCAHAVEGEYHGQPLGTLGDFGCFSFYVTKNVTCGEGGMIIARNEEHIQRIKRLALHGLSQDAWQRFSDRGYKHYQVTECGYKYNMMDLQAAIGIHQLARIEDSWLRRQRLWDRYQKALSSLPLTRPAEPDPETRHALHLYTVLVDAERTGLTRDTVLEKLHDRNIGAGVHYLSLPEHPYYQERYGWEPDDWPQAKRIGRQTLSLPLSPKLHDSDQDDIIGALQEFCASA
ncbi:DegT/DnrJ/EryC1/StrS family aminotransferase [Thiobacillus sp. 65-1402]|uniref:DegT/DnrJ/EryC1/StrS family aminotransferase n=1 Tax=Thiobacillus sp. 65-1402 TaxID=1895861 RepID=UPI000A4C3B21|nr:DegT/DnrJ/EryC1/StrS family aminotransferase [Thiobacillus sp. 65-1402]